MGDELNMRKNYDENERTERAERRGRILLQGNKREALYRRF